MSGLDGCINVVENAKRAIEPPANTATEEGGGEKRAIDSLIDGPCEIKFVAEPVDVEERRGQLIEQKDWGVEVNEGPLW